MDKVKGTMSETINVMIENTESIESIYTLAHDINTEAQVFKKNTSRLKNRLQCRVYKVSELFSCFFVV